VSSSRGVAAISQRYLFPQSIVSMVAIASNTNCSPIISWSTGDLLPLLPPLWEPPREPAPLTAAAARPPRTAPAPTTATKPPTPAKVAEAAVRPVMPMAVVAAVPRNKSNLQNYKYL